MADDFAEFMQSRVLNAPAIWDELLTELELNTLLGACRRADQNRRLGRSAPARCSPSPTSCAPRSSRGYARRLPKGRVPHLYELTDDELDLRVLMRDEMRALPCAEFERVLHPVFEEDELTLILIGTALGGAIAGAAQALSGI